LSSAIYLKYIHKKDIKTGFTDTIEVLKEETSKSCKEIYENINSGK